MKSLKTPLIVIVIVALFATLSLSIAPIVTAAQQNHVVSDAILPQATSPVSEIDGKENADVYLHSLDIQDGNYTKTIHVFVALCDNKYQGIVPVPAALGNGQNHNTNLYWGALYGIRTYFRKSKEWNLLATRQVDDVILERLIFKHAIKGYYMIADAYDGRYIEQCTKDFINSSSGNQKDTLQLDGKTLGVGGNASLLAYIGHNGLMDFELSETYSNTDNKKRDVIILACFSKRYFAPHLKAANVNPLLWTTHLMAPEAYTLHDALTGYVNRETDENIREKAAAAYVRYQKCSLRAARNLLVTGW